MPEVRSLNEIQRRSPEAVLAGLTTEGQSRDAGLRLLRDANSFGIGVRDYLLLSIDPRLSETPARFDGLNGYEASLAFLNMPVRNDFANGITLQAASQTFQTWEGSRAMFPEVVDDMMRWAYRQDTLETVEPLVSNSRTISGPELITAVILDPDNDKDNYRTSVVSEGGRIPVRTIRMTENSVKIWKHGSGYQTTYEFSRRASLDMLTPFAARVQRELERSKVGVATTVMLNGDGVHPAAGVVKQTAFGGTQSGRIEYKPLLKWLVSRAKAGVPVDMVMGNWDAYVEWLMLFMAPAIAKVASGEGLDTKTAAERLASVGVGLQASLPVLNFNVGFALSSTMGDGKLLGYTKAETLEELVEANSMISESEQSIRNQVITYVKTQSSGYKLAFGDTREIYDYTTA
ncbi:hypothetical protein D3877_23435 [Azospirillum cavernae]|jgi:hypothetical protein|uniref:Uncharacterized protein n=1 Tax=Azospirillum cavernae TaxID=2320860 RepID=A0A418VPA8_9PROT|nr:hypothetical protein [Azospirillum cavernae]RJF78086.1 hypothetical protein D3877_23435 [Azospirillum cavernae]